MAQAIWVFAEQWRGKLSDVTYEALALGRELADASGAPLEAILLGHQTREAIATLGKADSVLFADHPALAGGNVEVFARLLEKLVAERVPRVFLIPLTNVSSGIGTLISARLRLPCINFCKDARIAEGRFEARCILYGGKIEATVTADKEPIIVGLWPGARPADSGRAGAPALATEIAVELPAPPPVQLKQYIEPGAGDIDLTQQEVLVSVGRGIQGQDNIELAEELAKALGGAVCGSRPVIDQGWLPLSRQIGKSGLTVKPKLYLALGISGAPEHVEGMKDSALIVAVNTDRHAPIFNLAHYGIVADVLDLAPALTTAVLAHKKVLSHA